MSLPTNLDGALSEFFVAETLDGAPTGLLDAVLARTRVRAQRSRWELLLRRTATSRPAAAATSLRGSLRLLRVGVVLVVTLVGGGVLGLVNRPGTNPTANPSVDPARSGSPSAPAESARTSQPSTGIEPSLNAIWSADKPSDLRLTGPSGPSDLRLALGPHTTVVQRSTGAIKWLASDATVLPGSILSFTTSAGDPVADDMIDETGTKLRPCAIGSVGRYSWVLGPRDDTLSLVSLGDACAARVAVLADRLWSRVAVAFGGVPIRVDAFEPSFSVTLPDAEYDLTRTIASWSASHDGAPVFQAWLNPAGMREVCTGGSSRAETAAGQAGFVAFLRSRADFDLRSMTTRTVGGYAATEFDLHVKAADSCDSARTGAWQGYADSGPVATLRRGWTVHLVVTDVGDSTVLVLVDGGTFPGGDDPATVLALLDSITFGP